VATARRAPTSQIPPSPATPARASAMPRGGSGPSAQPQQWMLCTHTAFSYSTVARERLVVQLVGGAVGRARGPPGSAVTLLDSSRRGPEWRANRPEQRGAGRSRAARQLRIRFFGEAAIPIRGNGYQCTVRCTLNVRRAPDRRRRPDDGQTVENGEACSASPFADHGASERLSL
jgi:hypothetical protein